jgi:hypothetical protein
MQKRKKTKKEIKVQDIKPKKDAKGGIIAVLGPQGNPPKGAGPHGPLGPH